MLFSIVFHWFVCQVFKKKTIKKLFIAFFVNFSYGSYRQVFMKVTFGEAARGVHKEIKMKVGKPLILATAAAVADPTKNFEALERRVAI